MGGGSFASCVPRTVVAFGVNTVVGRCVCSECTNESCARDGESIARAGGDSEAKGAWPRTATRSSASCCASAIACLAASSILLSTSSSKPLRSASATSTASTTIKSALFDDGSSDMLVELVFTNLAFTLVELMFTKVAFMLIELAITNVALLTSIAVNTSAFACGGRASKTPFWVAFITRA